MIRSVNRALAFVALLGCLNISAGAEAATYGKRRGGGGSNASATASGAAYPQKWDSAILSAFQAQNSQLTEPAFPVFDFMEGTLAASRTTQAVTGTGTAQMSQAPSFGVMLASIGAGAGTVHVYPVNTPAMNGSFCGVPIAVAVRWQWVARTITSGSSHLMCILATNFAQAVCVGIVGSASTTNLSLLISGSGGPASTTAVTSFPIPALNQAVDIGMFWDGGRLIAFDGDALSGTFVPDLVNTINYVGSLTVGQVPASMPFIDIIDSVATSIYVDKFNGYMGVLQ